MEDIERTLLVKPEVFVYKIGPRPSARGYRAADWNLAAPDWTGRLRCLVKGKECEIKLEDKSTGELFAACPVEHYPGGSVEAVTDSSRYFVICIKDGASRKAYIGIGFSDRADSFDLNVALQDHFKWLKKEEGFTKEADEPPGPKLDLAFKAGQTIKINIPKSSSDGAATTAKSRPKTGGGALGLGGGGLPPPPGGIKLPPPGASAAAPSSANLTPIQSPSSNSSVGDLLGDFAAPPIVPAPAAAAATAAADSGGDLWGDFTSASPAASVKSSGNWEQF